MKARSGAVTLIRLGAEQDNAVQTLGSTAGDCLPMIRTPNQNWFDFIAPSARADCWQDIIVITPVPPRPEKYG